LGPIGSSSILPTRTSRRTSTWSDANVAKFWLDPARLARSSGFGRAELRDVSRLVNEHALELLEAWNGYFG
jgi:hypothetical protein